jgi:RNA polymerase sigma-70 factor (ECF subfamily)
MKPEVKASSIEAEGGGGVQGHPYERRFAEELAGLRPFLYGRASFLTQDPAGADDLVQETITRALSNPGAFRSGSNLRAWTASILRNLFIDGCRRAVHRELHEEDLAGHSLDEPIGPLDLLSLDDVNEAIGQLSPNCQDVLRLAHDAALSGEEMAARLGLKVNTVATRLFRARRKLRQRLEEVFRNRLVAARGSLALGASNVASHDDGSSA